MKVAAVLFVKDEVEDIAWWMAWHLSIGIDTLVIYDDYSSDGTWEVVNAAAKIYDVRPRRATQSLRFNHRQAMTYMDALDELREEFDWLVVLDADEYVDIKSGANVHTFLSGYSEDIDGVALNWKCFGSNRYVEKPPSPNVFENYITHSLPEFDLNQCVKSFFRPKKAETRYINPHRFAVSGRYVTPNGVDIEWQEKHDERTVALPDWSTAVIRHYIIRSAEHFVEKSKRRSDIRGAKVGIGLFNAYDKNELSDTVSTRRIEAIYPYIYGIQNQIALDIVLKNQIKNPKVYIKNLETSFQTTIVADVNSGRIGHKNLDERCENSLPVTIFSIEGIQDYLFLTVLEKFLPLHMVSEARVSTVLSYKVVKIQDRAIGIQSPITKKVVSFVLDQSKDDDHFSSAEANRDWTSLWETLIVKEDDSLTDNSLLAGLASAITNCDKPFVANERIDTRRLADASLAGLTLLSERSIRKIEDHDGFKVMPWMIQDKRLSL